jgi:hypothetical protein
MARPIQGTPAREPVTPPGIRVTYHGGSIELSVSDRGDTGKTNRVEVRVAQSLLDRRVARHAPEARR